MSPALAPLGYSVCFEGQCGANIVGLADPDPSEPEGNNIEAVCHSPG